jgi:hypothetical protein
MKQKENKHINSYPPPHPEEEKKEEQKISTD